MKILIEIFFSLKKYSRSRGHEDHYITLVKDQQRRLDIRKYSFSHRTINDWNKLSTDCVIASSLDTCKDRRLSRISGARVTHRCLKNVDSR